MTKKGGDAIRRFTKVQRLPSFEAFVERSLKYNPLRTEEQIRDRLSHHLREYPDGNWGWKWDHRPLRHRRSAPATPKTSGATSTASAPRPSTCARESDIWSAPTAERSATPSPAAPSSPSRTPATPRRQHPPALRHRQSLAPRYRRLAGRHVGHRPGDKGPNSSVGPRVHGVSIAFIDFVLEVIKERTQSLRRFDAEPLIFRKASTPAIVAVRRFSPASALFGI